jgi:hypothetical protein
MKNPPESITFNYKIINFPNIYMLGKVKFNHKRFAIDKLLVRNKIVDVLSTFSRPKKSLGKKQVSSTTSSPALNQSESRF